MRKILVFLIALQAQATALAPLARAEAATAPAGQKIKVAVLDLQPNGAAADLAVNATSLLSISLEKLEVFSVISRQEIRAMLSHEAEKQALGCEAGSSCLAEIGGALGVRYLVSGSLGLVGQNHLLTLALSDVERATVENRVSESVTDLSQLSQTVGRAARALVAKILADRTATLLVTCSEQGALVRIDGQAVGTTPLAPRPIAWGPHLIEVEKTGFIAATEDFTVQTRGVIEKRATLIPSGDFLRTYESSARRMRWGAWLSTAGAAAGLGAAAYFQTRVGATEDEYRSALDRYDQTSAAWQTLSNLKDRQSAELTNARLTGGVGLAFAVGAAFFWIAGEDPGRYANYRALASRSDPAEEGSPRLSLTVLPPGGIIGARLSMP